jgi:catechol 2,3-dioxygenase-like lactoylglutathione lyase family enzyme
MSQVNRISAVTLTIKNMERSCSFYTQIPGFKLTYGGTSNDSFTTYQIGRYNNISFLNLELKKFLSHDEDLDHENNSNNCGRIIFYTDDVDGLYTYFKTNKTIFNLIRLENEPVDAPWNERYFHIREPDGFQLSFAQPI